ncbi:MAG TPA: dTDP-4-dehydrorhamnose reductase [Pyrinomonadaceae bacterium]|nr:dTDP-4-dehydrorhamnose reductase [Pyrinomonadaceae bacterium]
MRILVTGAGGLVGRALQQHCLAAGDEVLAYKREELDITDSDLVEGRIIQQKPDAVVNCAAWTDVDGCETNVEKAYAVNAYGPENLARASRKAGAAFVTISTDYVFDGTKQAPYTQRDTPYPLSVYGKAKLDGERRSQAEYARSVIVRTGYIFGLGGKNYLSRVVDLARDKQPLLAISDATGTPTYARDLASRLHELAKLDLPGIFHVVNAGEGATFEQFSRAALKLACLDDSVLKVVSMDSLKRPAPRPVDSRLDCLMSKAIGLAPLPDWQDGLRRFVVESTATQPSETVAHISN